VRTERLDEAAEHLSELADEVESTHGHLRLTRRGRVSLVLLTEDEFASMQETITLAEDPAAQREIAAADEAGAVRFVRGGTTRWCGRRPDR
jgi:prevent-host-death family protein